MTLRCRIGDVAIVTRCDGQPDNIGAIVEVIAPSDVPSCDWKIRSAGRPLQAEGIKPDGRIVDGPFFDAIVHAPDDSLRPIRPAPEAQPAPPVAIPEESHA